MRYVVQSQDGRLEFQTFGDLEQAWLLGLVDPDDVVFEQGQQQGRPARSIPLLARARRSGDAVWGGAQQGWMVVSIVVGSVALGLLSSGHLISGGLLAVLLVVALGRATRNALRRTNPMQDVARTRRTP